MGKEKRHIETMTNEIARLEEDESTTWKDNDSRNKISDSVIWSSFMERSTVESICSKIHGKDLKGKRNRVTQIHNYIPILSPNRR